MGERLSRFDFEVVYREGTRFIQADTHSRTVLANTEEKCLVRNEKYEQIIKLHEKYGHRKDIFNLIRRDYLGFTANELNVILKKCKICLMKDKKNVKNAKFIHTERPGELVAFDLMEVKKAEHIIVGIDYFSRYAFAKKLKNKTASEVLIFIKKVFEILKFKKINADNGREFLNSKLKAWSRENNVEIEYSVPYYHQSNGRVERLNRTIRNGLKKLNGNISSKLKRVIDNYNEQMIHRGTGFTPKMALLIDNREEVLRNFKKYMNEFEFKNIEKF
ncbi:Pro-Pol polyprotein [Dictyocoela muelleri]|nr:Pro-Pol polyprotein [Dictyocoela muelleri]